MMKPQLDFCKPDRLRLLAEDLLPPGELAGLEQHLERCAECQEALDRLVGTDRCLTAARRYLGDETTVSYKTAEVAHESLDFLAPSDWPDSLGRLGAYEVKGVLGRGGMGVVLKAFDPALSRNVAIKVLSAPLATCGASRRRFLREARAAAAVVHEHVVGVFAVVESVGLPFLVMEYVPGHTLQDRLDRFGPLSLPEVLRIGTQTAAGLAAAHAQGLVHRDVKPANILLENGVERVRLTDFGLARAAADAALTHSGVVAGTPHYMAPEQASGETVDHRADLFSLGSTLYAMCAGHPPFRAESPLVVLRRVCDDEPRPLRELNPEVPAWLEAIISRLMAKDPARRFQTATDVALLLGSCLAHVQQPLSVPLPAELAALPNRTGKWRRYWIRGSIVASVLAAVAAGAGSLALLPPRPNELPGPTRGAPRPALSVVRTPRPVDPPRIGTDEIAQNLGEAWRLAGTIEAGLHRREDLTENDPVSTLVHDLAQQARALESEIASQRETDRRNPFVRSTLHPDRRR
jgi:serine/threonine protein kinase